MELLGPIPPHLVAEEEALGRSPLTGQAKPAACAISIEHVADLQVTPKLAAAASQCNKLSYTSSPAFVDEGYT